MVFRFQSQPVDLIRRGGDKYGAESSSPLKAINLPGQPTGGSEHAMQALFLNPAAHPVKNYLCCAARRAI